ncbi:MAG: nuclease-related domain-containing protein [Candidatus Methanospirareceae archaeon]
MATVLKQQHSLDSAFQKRAAGGVLCIAIGVLIIFIVTRFAFVSGGFLIVAGAVLIKNGYTYHRGAVGEGRVAAVLARLPDGWFIVHDMVVGRAQIDHIVVSPAGVYTIETKHYTGTIHGNAEQQHWSQVINKQHKTNFYNPIKQGNGHSVALSTFLAENGFPHFWVNTIVVFSDPHVKLKVSSSTVPVLYLAELRDYLKRQKPVMSLQSAAAIAECISSLV